MGWDRYRDGSGLKADKYNDDETVDIIIDESTRKSVERSGGGWMIAKG